MTSEIGEIFNALKKERQEKRANNRVSSAEYLRKHGIPFVEKNLGAHLIVEDRECFIDFWPGTGKWYSRCGKKGFGVCNLVAFIGAPSNAGGKDAPNAPNVCENCNAPVPKDADLCDDCK